MTFSQTAKTALCRAYQKSAYVLSLLTPWKERALLKGTGSFKKLAVYLKNKNIDSILIIADEAVVKNGMLEPLTVKLDELGIKYSVAHEKAEANAETVQRCADTFVGGQHKAIVAIGGGSAIDCGKLTAIKTVNEYGMAKPLFKRLPPLFAVPTTVGSGSESSCSAVCYDKKAKERNVISSRALRPAAAVLDPHMTDTLPKDALARTAMAALARAVEAYLSVDGTKSAYNDALIAVRLVYDNVLKAYEDNDIDARTELQKAAYLAGSAAARNHCGYAHHIALAVSAAYRSVSYSEVAAAALPEILKAYGEKAYRKLAALADAVKLKGDSDKEKAEAFISEIEKLYDVLSMSTIVKQIKKKDIPKIAQKVCKYCNPSYPAPRILFLDDICDVLASIKA